MAIYFNNLQMSTTALSSFRNLLPAIEGAGRDWPVVTPLLPALSGALPV